MAILFYDQWYDVFSSFSAHAVEIDGVVYPTAEHAYQAAKCTDPQGKAEILVAKSPLQTKDLSNEKYKYAKRDDWDEIKVDIMESIFRAKLEQHKEVRDALVKSGGEELIEDSPVDSFWGGGKDGEGQNMIGKIWMKLREEINS